MDGFMGEWINLELIQIITSCKGSLWSLCFYTCLSVHRGGGIPACLAGGIPACLVGLQGVSRPTPRGKLKGLARGSPGPHLGSPGPHPGCLQAHTQGGVSRPTPRECVYPSMHWGRHHHPLDGYGHRQYASYWNAFLFDSVWTFMICRDSPTYGWMYGLADGMDG